MALLLQGRGYSLRRGVHFRDGGTSACSQEGGTESQFMLPDSPDCGLSPNNPGRDGTRSSRRLFAYSPEPKAKVSRKPTEPLPSAQLSAAASGAAQARWVVGPQLALRRFALPLYHYGANSSYRYR